MRRARIILLARRRSFDYLAPLEGMSRSGSPPGPAAGRRVPCDCARLQLVVFWDAERREKQRYDLVGEQGCPSCGATGWRLRDSHIDGPLYASGRLIERNARDERGITLDEFTYGQALAVATKRARELGHQERQTMTERQLGVALDRLALTWPSLADPAEVERLRARDQYGWERARERHVSSGSFVQLERALDELRIENEALHRLFMRAYCFGWYGDPPAVSAVHARLLGLAVSFIDARMPDPIRLPVDAEEQLAAAKRAESVKEIYAETGSLTKTAHRARVSRTKVRQMLRREGVLAA